MKDKKKRKARSGTLKRIKDPKLPDRPCNICEKPFKPDNKFSRFCEPCKQSDLYKEASYFEAYQQNYFGGSFGVHGQTDLTHESFTINGRVPKAKGSE